MADHMSPRVIPAVADHKPGYCSCDQCQRLGQKKELNDRNFKMAEDTYMGPKNQGKTDFAGLYAN